SSSSRARQSDMRGPALRISQLLLSLGLTLATPPAFAQWAGSVVSAADGAPIAGAIVRVEAGESVFTDADGAFLLPGPIADDAKIVAGAKGYYYAALSAPADGLWSFQLEPVPHD